MASAIGSSICWVVTSVASGMICSETSKLCCGVYYSSLNALFWKLLTLNAVNLTTLRNISAHICKVIVFCPSEVARSIFGHQSELKTSWRWSNDRKWLACICLKWLNTACDHYKLWTLLTMHAWWSYLEQHSHKLELPGSACVASLGSSIMCE